MALIRASNDLDFFGRRFSDIIDELFNDALSTRQSRFVPGIDVVETENSYEIEFHLPGVKKEEITVSLDNNMLTVSGERKFEKEEKEKRYHRIESRYGSFSRSLQLPENVDADSIEAKSENGVLRVTVQKSDEKVSKQIEIK